MRNLTTSEVMRVLTTSEMEAVAGGTSINTTRSNIKSGITQSVVQSVVVVQQGGSVDFGIKENGTR